MTSRYVHFSCEARGWPTIETSECISGTPGLCLLKSWATLVRLMLEESTLRRPSIEDKRKAKKCTSMVSFRRRRRASNCSTIPLSFTATGAEAAVS